MLKTDFSGKTPCIAFNVSPVENPKDNVVKSIAIAQQMLCWQQVEKEREALRFEMNKAAAQMKEADAAIAAQKAELDKLNQIITEADQVTSLTGLGWCFSTTAQLRELRKPLGLGLSL